MTVSTENTTFPKSTTLRNPNFSVQIQIISKSQFEFAPLYPEESQWLDLVDFGGVAISMETVTYKVAVELVYENSYQFEEVLFHSLTWE